MDGAKPFPPNRLDKVGIIGLKAHNNQALKPKRLSELTQQSAQLNISKPQEALSTEEIPLWSDHHALVCSFDLIREWTMVFCWTWYSFKYIVSWCETWLWDNELRKNIYFNITRICWNTVTLSTILRYFGLLEAPVTSNSIPQTHIRCRKAIYRVSKMLPYIMIKWLYVQRTGCPRDNLLLKSHRDAFSSLKFIFYYISGCFLPSLLRFLYLGRGFSSSDTGRSLGFYEFLSSASFDGLFRHGLCLGAWLQRWNQDIPFACGRQTDFIQHTSSINSA